MPWVAQTGTPGTDWSVNPPDLTGLNQLRQIPANPRRNNIGVQNQSTATLTVVRDDGTGGNVTALIVGPANAAGGQGNDWSSLTFKGRLTIYGTAGSQLAAYED